MILTVTCNPAIDTTYAVDGFVPGRVHRVVGVDERPGGKGVNVARVLHQLGEAVTALGLGDAGFAARVEALGLPASFVPLLPAVRRTLVVQDAGATTSLWEPGPVAGDGAGAALVDLVGRHLQSATAVVVSGSLPAGVDPSLPAQIAALARAAGVPAVLDLDGEALAIALAQGGAVLTPNRDELAGLLGSDQGDLAQAATELALRNRAPVVLTLGEHGLLAADGSGCWHASPPSRLAGNPTGAGDATAAGIVRGLARGSSIAATLPDAVGLGAAAVLAPVAGEVDVAVARRLTDAVQVEPVDSFTLPSTLASTLASANES